MRDSRNRTFTQLTGEPIENIAAPAINPFEIAHRMLRGRYKQAVILGLVLGVLGLFGGWLAVKPIYVAEGSLNVTPAGTRLVHETDENRPVFSFVSFVEAQAALVRSRGVLEVAAVNPELRALRWPIGEKGIAALEGGIEVQSNQSSQLIRITCPAGSAAVSQAAVNAVLDAYVEQYGQSGRRLASSKERLLADRQTALEQELRTINARLIDETGGLGRQGLADRQTLLVRQIDLLDERVSALSRVMPPLPVDGPDSTDYRRLLWDVLASSDKQLADMMTEEMKLQLERDALPSKYGPNHPSVRAFQERLDLTRSRIGSRVEMLLTMVGVPGDDWTPGAESPANRDRFEALLTRLALVRVRASDEAAQLGRKLLAANTLDAEVTKTRKLFDETSTELEKITAEASAALPGRIQIAQRAELPLTPWKDRRKPLAAFGLIAGFGGGFALVALAGFVNRRYRYVDELESLQQAPPVIGVLPEVAGGCAENSRAAALSVHHLRNMIQLPEETRLPATYMVTSPSSGDGKTSLTLALGMSFAAAGYRVVLVDADIIGRGLTSELSERGTPGLCDALHSGDPLSLIRPTATPGLSVLPVGVSADDQVERLSRQRFKGVLDTIRESFDIVLVDSGPLLGSIDAHLIGGLADGVLLVVSRGSSSRLVQASLSRLEHLNIEPRGIVFNKAEQSDFDKCLAYGSIRESSSRSSFPVEQTPEIVVPRRSLARAMRGLGRHTND